MIEESYKRPFISVIDVAFAERAANKARPGIEKQLGGMAADEVTYNRIYMAWAHLKFTMWNNSMSDWPTWAQYLYLRMRALR